MILAAVATALSVVMYVLADRHARRGSCTPCLATGTVILTLANYFVEADGRSTRSSTRGPRSTPSTSSGCRVALAHVALIARRLRIVLIADRARQRRVRWLLAVGTPLIAGLLISRLLTRLRAEGLSAEERARARCSAARRARA